MTNVIRRTSKVSFERVLLFSDELHRCLQVTRRGVGIFVKAISILLKRKKRLEVRSLRVNDSYLFANGLVIIKWELRNFLWIRINSKIICTNGKGVLLHFNRIKNPLTTEIVGLFGRYKRDFLLTPVAMVDSKSLHAPQLSSEKFLFKKFGNALSSFSLAKGPLRVINVSDTSLTKSPEIRLHLSTFKKECFYEYRVL